MPKTFSNSGAIKITSTNWDGIALYGNTSSPHFDNCGPAVVKNALKTTCAIVGKHRYTKAPILTNRVAKDHRGVDVEWSMTSSLFNLTSYFAIDHDNYINNTAYEVHIVGEKKFTLSYEANGGSGTMEPEKDLKFGANVMLLNRFIPPSGKVFSHWVVDGKVYQDGDYIVITKDTVATAHWKDNDAYGDPRYTVLNCYVDYNRIELTPLFNMDQTDYVGIIPTGGKKLMANESLVNPKSKVVRHMNDIVDDTVAHPPIYIDHVGGTIYPDMELGVNTYTLKFVVTSEDGNNTKTYTITLHREGTHEIYTVKFDSNGGTLIPEQKVSQGNTVKKPTDPEKGANTFDGWYSDKEFTEEFDFTTPINKDTTLYAKWIPPELPKHTVSFESNGGTDVANQEVIDGYATTQPTNPTKEGFVFDDWYSDKELTSVFDFTTPITSDIKLYAKWTPTASPVYSISVSYGTATVGGVSVKESTAGVKIDLKATIPAGKVIDKWVIVSGAPELVIDNVNLAETHFHMPAKDVSIKATFKNKPGTPTPGGGEIKSERIDGKDRMETAIALSKTYFTKANTVILASADNYPDALTASVLAGVVDGPILLTNRDKVNEAILKEIQRLGTKEVIVVGGSASISDATAKAYAADRTLNRYGGKDRYETAGLLADAVTKLGGQKERAFITTGENYPDALAISPQAYNMRTPILLVRAGEVPEATKAALERNQITKTVLVGGETSISEKVAKALPGVEKRLSGEDRYETALAIAREYNKSTPLAYLASGENYPDALSAGPIAGKNKAPLLLSTKAALKANTIKYLKEAGVKKVIVVGGPSTLSEAVIKDISEIK